MIIGIHHFSIIVSCEETVSFYKKLGFIEVKRIDRQYDTVVLMEGHGIGLEVFLDSKHIPRSNPEPLGLRNLSLAVDNIDNVLVALRIETGQKRTDWYGNQYVFITDPDGNKVQLYEQ